MQTRTLGRTDLPVTTLSLGTMTWGQQNTEEEAFAQMDHALDAGLKLWDAAELYPIPRKAETQGRTEEYIGNWLKARPGARDKIVLASKVLGRSDADWFRDDGHAPRLTRADINEAIDKTLRRLKTDHVDLYQVHWPDRPLAGFGSNPNVFKVPESVADETPIAESLEALADLVKAGKVRHIGLSNESTWGLMKWLEASDKGHGPRVVSIQNAYSLVNRTFEVNLAEASLREDVSLLTYSTLAQGYLTGKYRGGAQPEGARKTLFNSLTRYEGPGAAEAIERYLTLADEAGIDPTKMAIAFALSRPFVTSVILGATSVEQMKTVIDAADMTLPADLLNEIDNIHRAHGNPCP